MKNTIKKATYLFMISMVLFQSCSDDDDNNSPEPIVTTTVQLVEDDTLGSILTDSDGYTLYFFSKDTKNTSVCVDGCVDTWPVFYSEDIVIEEGLEINDFATITRTDGELQTTYKGWPLYYFISDVKPGDTNGENVNNIWFVAKPDYSLMYVNAQLHGLDDNNYTSTYTVGDEETSYIVDIDGRTLYTFSNDTNNTNNFTASDFSNNGVWPIAEITLDKIPSILNSDDFGTIDVYGRTQLTYKGWPLYYFGEDADRGDNKGVSYPSPGVWPIANVDTEVAP